MIEFEKLRYEIMESDRISIWILGYSFVFTSGILSLKGFTSIDIKFSTLTIIAQIMWVLSFNYLSVKRFSILKIACYIKDELETKYDDLNWETWYRQKNFPGPIDMYGIETITSILAVGFLSTYSFMPFSVYSMHCVIAMIINLVFIVIALVNYRKYRQLEQIVKGKE